MTPAEFATLVRQRTGTNSTTFTDAEILALMNAFRDTFAIKIVKRVGEDYFLMKFYRDLEADVREYGFPDEVIGKIKSVQAKLDGSAWSELREFDLSQYRRPTDEGTIREQFSGRRPAFDIIHRSLVIYSGDAVVAVADGLVLYASCELAKWTSLSGSVDMAVNPTTTSFGLPRGFHELMARKVQIEWKNSQDKPVPLSLSEKAFEDDFKAALDDLAGMNEDRGFVPSCPVDTGEDY